MYGKNMKYFSI